MRMCMEVKIIVITAISIQVQTTSYNKEKYLKGYGAKWSSAYLPDHIGAGWKTPCSVAINDFHKAITSSQPKDAWAATMVDSWGKSLDGFFYGVPYILGAFDQCLRTASPDNNIRGKYCSIYRPLTINADGYSLPLAQNSQTEWEDYGLQWTILDYKSLIKPFVLRDQSMDQLIEGTPDTFLKRGLHQLGMGESPEDQQINGSDRMGGIPIFHPYMFLTYGTCMPNVCTKDELQLSLDSSHNSVVMKCDEPYLDISLDAVDISFISFYGVIAVFTMVATTAHGYIAYTKQEHLTKGPLKFILTFAVSLNLKKIFTINTKPAPGTISCLNGMRVMSMCWVIWGHQNMKTLWTLANQNNLYMIDKPLFQILRNAYVSVDSFFFMGGLLVCYSVMREMKKTGKLNILMYYIHRIIRLTPPIAVAVWYFSTLNRFIARGPIPFSFSINPSDLANKCREFGWKDYAFVNNIPFTNNQTIPEGCIGQCWYTSVDTQLYALAPLVLLPLYHYKTAGRAWLYMVTIAAVVMRGFITWYSTNGETGANGWMYDNYYSTWTRADSWLIGVWTGYFIANMGKKKLVLKPWQVVVGWTISVLFGLMVVFGRYKAPYPAVGAGHIMYEMVHRTVWASCLSWVTVACHYGYGGIVNDFLSHSSWQPFSRLTYSMYLVSLEVSYTYITTSKNLFYFTNTNKIIETCGVMFISTLFALILSLTIEAPILGLEKLLLKRPGNIKESQVKGHVNTSFENTDKEDNPIRDLAGTNSEAVSVHLEPNRQSPTVAN